MSDSLCVLVPVSDEHAGSFVGYFELHVEATC